MSKIPFLNSKAYQFSALCFWFISYFLFAKSQHVINLTYFFLLLPTLLTIRTQALRQYISHPLVWVFITYLIITIAEAFHSGKPESQVVYCFVVFLFYLTVYRLPPITIKQENILAWAWFAVVLIYASYNVAKGWQNGSWHFGERFINFSAFINNPIYVADLLTIGLAMISFNAIRSNKLVNACGAHVITLFVGLVILQSRSMLPVWLVISLLTVVTGFFESQHNCQADQVTDGYKQRKRNLLLLAIPVALLIYILSSDIGSAILARADSYRLEIWQAYIKQTIDCGIWFGCGMNEGVSFTTKDGHPIVHAHNILIANFAKTGLIGTILVLALLITATVYGLRKKHMAAWVLIAGITALMFDGSSLIKSPNEQWILFHLPLAYLIKLMIEQKIAK